MPAFLVLNPDAQPSPATVNEQQTVSTGGATGGTFTLTFDGQTTAAIAYNATAAVVQAALEALSNVNPGDVYVSGGVGEYTLIFAGQYAGVDVPQTTLNSAGLTGGTGGQTAVSVPGYTAPAGSLLPYRIVIRSAAGTKYGELANFVLNRITWELGGLGSAEFTVVNNASAKDLIKVPHREVEIWRGNNLLWAGPMVRASSQGNEVNVQCQGLGWYFKRRHIGKADRTNYLGNPSFEDSPTGSFPSGWGPGGVTATVVESPRLLGSRAVELYQTGVDVDTHIHRQIWFTTDSDGLYVTFVGHFYISEWLGTSFEERGLFIEVRDNFVGNGTAANPEGRWTHYEFLNINEQTPRNTWIRAEVGIHIPPNVTAYSVDARCYGIGGRIVWDACSVTVMESLAMLKPDEEQTAWAARIVAHAQDSTLGKSNLNIGQFTPATGIRRAGVAHQYADHLPISDALDAFPNLRDGFESDIVVTPTARTYTTYYPIKANRRPDVRFELGPAFGEFFGTIVDYSVEVDGENTANEIVVLGEGEGPDREEGAATDAASLEGLTLEKVIFPPAGSPIDVLDSLASKALDKLKRPVTVVTITVKDPALIGSLQTGDIVGVVIDHEWTQVNGEYRIVRIELDAANETLSLSLNEAVLYE